MGRDASRRNEASICRARCSWRPALLLLVLIAVSLACRSTPKDPTAAPSPSSPATAAPAVALPVASATPSEAALTSAPPSKAEPTITLPVVGPELPTLPLSTLPSETATEPAPPSPTAEPPTLAPTIAPTLAVIPQPVAVDPQITTRQTAVFEEIWGVIRDRYLYPDFNGLDWNAVGQEYRVRIQAGMTDADFYASMHAMIQRLGDEHSVYFSPEEADRIDQQFQGQSSFVGVGLSWMAIPERKRLAVVLVFPGSPAEAAGLRPHDSLLAVDGQPVIDEQGKVQNLLIGPEGSTVQLTVQSPGQEPRQISIIRRPITGQMPVPHQAVQTASGKRIGYILIPSFNETHIDEAVGEALSELGNAGPLDGLIIDNRHNRGGASDVLMNTLSYFINGAFGSFIENRNDIPLQVRGQNLFGSQTAPMVVLIGPNTISFGEVFSGAVKDLGRAHLIGTQTGGNVEVLSIFNFSDGSRAWIATSTFRPLNNPSQDWEQTGITPDQVVESQWDMVTFETDPAVLAALQYLDSLPTP